jgi:hypothetical protein
MRAITVKQPWSTAIAVAAVRPDLAKLVENRDRPHPWRAGIGERIAIHAGQTWDHDADGDPRLLRLWSALSGWLAQNPLAQRRGEVLATAVLADVHTCDGSCSPWAVPDAWHLVLVDVQLVTPPAPARGALGWWQWEAA